MPPCNPLFQTCLETTWASSLPTGLGGSLDAGPVCSSESLSGGSGDFYGTTGPVSLDGTSAAGVLGLFRNATPVSAADTLLPPRGVDLPVASHRAEFPAEVMPYVNLMTRLETEFGVPVSFRIVQARLSNGETMPQILFYRTGDTPELPAFRGGGGPASGGPAPRATTTGLTVSLLGGAALIVAFDRLLLDSLVDHDLMPNEARIPILFTSVMTAHLALHRAGLVQATPRQGLAQAPTFMGFQILASLLLERLGADPSSAGTQFLSLTLASMPFLLARQSPMLAEALTARGLTLAELGTMSTGAATLRVGALFARALGYVGLIDLGARAGTWGIGHIVAATSAGDYDDNMRLWNLVRMSQDIINQEDAGSVLAGAFGMFMTAGDSLAMLFDDDYEADYTARLERVRDELVAGSDEFGESMHRSILSILARNTPLDGQGRPGRTDWEGFRRDLREFYQEDGNAENISRGYDLVDDATAPMTVSGIETLIEVVDDDGEITDFEGFRSHFRIHLNVQTIELARRIEERSLELGLMEDVGGVRVSRIPADPAGLEAFRGSLNAEQRAFLEGDGLQWTMELLLLESLRTSLDE